MGFAAGSIVVCLLIYTQSLLIVWVKSNAIEPRESSTQRKWFAYVVELTVSKLGSTSCSEVQKYITKAIFHIMLFMWDPKYSYPMN